MAKTRGTITGMTWMRIALVLVVLVLGVAAGVGVPRRQHQPADERRCREVVTAPVPELKAGHDYGLNRRLV